MARHTVQKGETPQSIARSYTGNESRYRDLLAVNPRVGQVTGQMGAPEADPRDWNVGMVVQIPDRWLREEGQLGTPRFAQNEVVTWANDGGSYSEAEIAEWSPRWEGPGYGGSGQVRLRNQIGAPRLRQAKRPLGVKLKKPGIPIKGPWDQLHPQWEGSYIAYWSQRIESTIVSGANNYMGQFVQCSHEFNYGSGRARLYSWLRSYSSPSEFYETFDGHLDFPTKIPMQMWFAHPWDKRVTQNAAWEFVNGHCG